MPSVHVTRAVLRLLCSVIVHLTVVSARAKLSCSPDFSEYEHRSWELTDVITSTHLLSSKDCCSLCGIYSRCAAWTFKRSTGLCSISFSNATRHVAESVTVTGLRHEILPPEPPAPPVPIKPNPPLGFQPNILLLFPDEWRYDWDGLHNDEYPHQLPLRMPNMKRFAQRGTRFTHAYVPSPLCAPSRAALAAGREYDQAGVPGNKHDYPTGQETFYLQLQKAGYHTMLAGKDDLTKGSQIGAYEGQYSVNGTYRNHDLGVTDGVRTAGKDSVVASYPVPHDEYGLVLGAHVYGDTTGWVAHHECGWSKTMNRSLCNSLTFPEKLYQDNWVADKAKELLDRKPDGKPWFMQVNFPGPHPPFLVTALMADSVANRSWPKPFDSTDKTGRDKCLNKQQPHEPANGNNYQLCNYGAEVENLDRLFGEVVDYIEATGELEHTLICLASDHGDMTGDHNGKAKGLPWQSSASVPLLCFGGSDKLKVGAGKVISAPTATMDLAATFIDYAGGLLAADMTSTSLRPVLEGHNETVREIVSSGLGHWRMVVRNVEDTWLKFICGQGAIKYPPSTAASTTGGWTRLLYDVEHDPFDMHDLGPGNETIMKQLSKLLPREFAGCGWT